MFNDKNIQNENNSILERKFRPSSNGININIITLKYLKNRKII
jgi:hypothetical protein